MYKNMSKKPGFMWKIHGRLFVDVNHRNTLTVMLIYGKIPSRFYFSWNQGAMPWYVALASCVLYSIYSIYLLPVLGVSFGDVSSYVCSYYFLNRSGLLTGHLLGIAAHSVDHMFSLYL